MKPWKDRSYGIQKINLCSIVEKLKLFLNNPQIVSVTINYFTF